MNRMTQPNNPNYAENQMCDAAGNWDQSAFKPFVPLKPNADDLPAFPVGCLPARLREYVKAVAEHTQTPVDMAAGAALGVLATCLQGKVRVEGNIDHYEQTSLYIFLVAPPGSRKSAVIHAMTDAIADYEQGFNEKQAPQLRKNRQDRESLQRQINRLSKQLDSSYDSMTELELQHTQDNLNELEQLHPLQLFTDDCTSEMMIRLLKDNHGRMALISAEGGAFDNITGRYTKKPNLDVWLKGICGDTIRVDRLNRDPDYVRNPAISMIISAQPTVLSDIMQNGMLDGRGFLARLFYVNVAGASFSRAFRSSPIPQELKDDYRKLIFSLLDIPSDQMITLHLTPEAVTRMDKLCNEMESDLRKYHRDMREWGSKFIGLALRIAGLLHVADGLTDDIGENHIGCAITIGRYAFQHAMPEVKDPKTKSSKRIVPAADRLKKVLDAIDRKSGFYLCGKDGETPLSYSETRRSFEKIRKAFDLQDYTAHDFRDTCATEWRENGMSIDLIAKILGHANSKITEQRYVKYRVCTLDEAKKKMELTNCDS